MVENRPLCISDHSFFLAMYFEFAEGWRSAFKNCSDLACFDMSLTIICVCFEPKVSQWLGGGVWWDSQILGVTAVCCVSKNQWSTCLALGQFIISSCKGVRLVWNS